MEARARARERESGDEERRLGRTESRAWARYFQDLGFSPCVRDADKKDVRDVYLMISLVRG